MARLGGTAIPFKWPSDAKTAIALTLDNMGEAADLNRGLWPDLEPVGSHYTVTEVLPIILALLKKYDIHVTYFIESWNLKHYGEFIAYQVAKAGHEVAWHAWQHEAWSSLDEVAERANFERSFGIEGLRGFGAGAGQGKVLPYRGFRPPGGRIHGDRTLSLCREYGLGYISPAAENAAIVNVEGNGRQDSIVVLPFRWRTVDAIYYMEQFSGLRKLKDMQEHPMTESQLVVSYKREIDNAIADGQFLSLLFHPFLTNTPARLEAMEEVVQYLALKRDQRLVWLDRCRDIEQYCRQNPRSVAKDPQYDTAEWR
ncbi:hypothetical protein DOTSEDRAFT_127950 [Dothistroma septosporum NZE10]|uniref:chitin deacetylase n=1 Tax=Dothistroma septosporum (strain NZE10 / CBS 128990) TaxID=675120 RepID=N1PS14_DOTSN|nr:hypothetical protein DOTSEDRAFT_127950 [Dothistroma septosporum NZE10]